MGSGWVLLELRFVGLSLVGVLRDSSCMSFTNNNEAFIFVISFDVAIKTFVKMIIDASAIVLGFA